jgi:hypothetical protein
MAALVTLDLAKLHLRITDSALDTLIDAEILQASTLVQNWCNLAPLEGWTAATVPDDTQSAVLELIEILHRPGEPPAAQPFPTNGLFTASIVGKLSRWHSTVVA